jgi:hypothetical protein
LWTIFPLTISFRSTAPVLDAVNANLLAAGARMDGAVRRRRLAPSRALARGAGGLVELLAPALGRSMQRTLCRAQPIETTRRRYHRAAGWRG